MEHDVDHSWGRIVSWLERHAPASLASVNPPATEAQIAAVRDAVGMPLPEDLTAWWRLANGVSTFPGLEPVPCYNQLSTEESLSKRARSLSEHDPAARALSAKPAGIPAGIGWLPEWLPLASDHCGWHLFVDLRSGPLRGCVMEYDKYEGVWAEPLWPSTASLLERSAGAIENGRELGNWRPRVNEQAMLEWAHVDGPGYETLAPFG